MDADFCDWNTLSQLSFAGVDASVVILPLACLVKVVVLADEISVEILEQGKQGKIRKRRRKRKVGE